MEPLEPPEEPIEPPMEPLEPPEEPIEPPMEPLEPPDEPIEPPMEPLEPPEEPIEPPMEPLEPPEEPIEPPMEPLEPPEEPIEPPEEPPAPPDDPELPPGEGMETGGPPDGEETPSTVLQLPRTSPTDSAKEMPNMRVVNFMSIGLSTQFDQAYHRQATEQPFPYLMHESAVASLLVFVVVQSA